MITWQNVLIYYSSVPNSEKNTSFWARNDNVTDRSWPSLEAMQFDSQIHDISVAGG